MAEILNITLSKTQLPDGNWFLYYDGDDLDLPCGTHYIKAIIDGVPWYSELFTVKNINSAIHPGLIADKSHTALRFHDSKIKQNTYKCNDFCDLGLINPIDHIIPFVIDLTGLPAPNIPLITTKIICFDGGNQYDLSSEFGYTYNSDLKTLIHDGRKLSGQLYCGVYYLEVNVNGNTFYSEHFKVENITGVQNQNVFLYTESGTETGFEQIITDDLGQSIILNI